MGTILKDRVALVTGAVGGIGRSISLHLAAEGAILALNYLVERDEDAEEYLKELTRQGFRASLYKADVSRSDEAVSLVERVTKDFGRIDVLINNAGTAWGAPVEEMRLEHWNKVIETNLTGTFLFSQAVGRFMVRQRRGKIINMASVAGMRGAPAEFQAIGYHASKGGVIAFTKDLACKWGIHNIQVNAIAPGWFPTRMSEVMIERNRDAFLKKIPLGRFGSDHDLKGAAVFLASDASNFVTGHVLVVDGGQTA